MNNLNLNTTSQAIRMGTEQAGDTGLTKEFLDSNFPLNEGSHSDVAQYRVYFDKLVAHLTSGRCVGLLSPAQFSDFGGDRECPSSILLGNAHQQVELSL